MEITVKWFNDSFNVGLASKAGAEEFLSIKGCRIKEYDGKTFVGFPAQKNEKTGKWWNHVWASDKFQSAVIEKALEGRPNNPRSNPAPPDEDSDIPFAPIGRWL